MTAALPEAVRAAGTPVEVWFQDEARVGQQGTLTYVWAEKGSRPRALKDLRCKWAYLFGAVCAEHGVGAALVLPHANADAMTLRLAEVSRHVTPAPMLCWPATARAGTRPLGACGCQETSPCCACPPTAPS